jgi:hypothetical protein
LSGGELESAGSAEVEEGEGLEGPGIGGGIRDAENGGVDVVIGEGELWGLNEMGRRHRRRVSNCASVAGEEVRVRRPYSIVKPRTCSVAANFVGGSVDVKGIVRLHIKEGRHADD